MWVNWSDITDGECSGDGFDTMGTVHTISLVNLFAGQSWLAVVLLFALATSMGIGGGMEPDDPAADPAPASA